MTFVRVVTLVGVTWFLSIITTGAVAHNTPPADLVAKLRTYDYKTKTFDETTYVVDATTMHMAPSTHSSVDFESLRTERIRKNIEIYNRLKEQLNEQTAPERKPVLVTCVHEIEKAKTCGASPGDQMLISPNGRRVAIQPDLGTAVVVDLITMGAQQFVKRSDFLRMAMAWSPDSSRLAYASDTKEVIVYDVEHGVVESRLQGTWAQAIAWSPDMQALAIMTLVNRRLLKTPKALLAAGAGHPDYRNDLILETRSLANQKQQLVPLKSNLDEQAWLNYEIEWR